MQNDGSIAIDNYGATASNFDDASPVKQFFRNKWVRLILAIDVIAIIAVVAILIFNNTKTATINLNVTPVDASIQIGATGGGYTNGSYQIHPGTYDITISHDGLESKTFTLDLKSGYNTTLTTFLKGEGDNFAFYTYKDNYDSLQKLISIASSTDNQTTDQDPSAEQFIQNYEHASSILKVLPIRGYVYTDSQAGASGAGFAILDGTGKKECEKVICLLVNYVRKGAEPAITKKIEEAGYNPADYQIIYERYD